MYLLSLPRLGTGLENNEMWRVRGSSFALLLGKILSTSILSTLGIGTLQYRSLLFCRTWLMAECGAGGEEGERGLVEGS